MQLFLRPLDMFSKDKKNYLTSASRIKAVQAEDLFQSQVYTLVIYLGESDWESPGIIITSQLPKRMIIGMTKTPVIIPYFHQNVIHCSCIATAITGSTLTSSRTRHTRWRMGRRHSLQMMIIAGSFLIRKERSYRAEEELFFFWHLLGFLALQKVIESSVLQPHFGVA